ncbi:NAD-dependent epimerase/dehydratase family protein [Runella zeae]|uniref:NAD-dependent epimerase/dehydratase family protein n=1 Tax=Runella zeae TaxID=94255 RepID=UPI002356B94E|nr:NAD-dependent epimerase/dehydratase family protein [Runella zeae]
MNVLVLGGTGAMGVHLVQLLSDNDFETVVTTRASRKNEYKVKYIQGNAHDIEFLQTILLEGWDAIIDFMVYSTAEFKSRVDLLLQSTAQYIFLSSARVYADSPEPIRETSSRLLDVAIDERYLSTDEYALTKARQEDTLKNSEKNNWTIIRPYITYSENRLQLGVLEKEEWLYRALKGRTIVFSEDIISKTTTLTYGLDVAKGITSVIGKRDALGEVYHITGDSSIKWKDVLCIYLNVLEKHLGYKPKVLLSNLDKFMEIHPAEYQIKYDRLYNRAFNNSKISDYVETSTFMQTEEGLSLCLETFLKDPKFSNINWGKEAVKDKLTKEYSSLKEIKGTKQKIKYLIFKYLK